MPVRGAARELGLVFFGSVFLTLASRVTIPLPFTPVPVTMQTFGVFLLGAFLGRKAFYSVFLYLLEGSLGLPVFSSAAGVMGPTGGYLAGFMFAAFVVGWFAEKKWKNDFLNI